MPPRGSRHGLQRDLLAGHHLDLFLVSAVCTVLLIRFSLHLTGYPTVGGSHLHIAHMLWGGLLMLAALIVLLAYLGRRSRQYAAFLGGVGFGTFIDEVGKFLTHDNDYFYRPGVAVIYVIFVLFYLVARSLIRRRPSHVEYLVNALQEVGEVAAGDLDREERDRALGYLARGRQGDLVVATLRDLLRRSDLIEVESPGRLATWRRRILAGYKHLAVSRQFTRGLVMFFIAQLTVKLVYLGVMWFGQRAPHHLLLRLQNPWSVTPDGSAFSASLLLAASLLQIVFVSLGLIKLKKSRLDAFHMFQRSILVSIFFSQVLLFYRDQWGGLIGLGFNVLLFAALRFMIGSEQT